MNLTKMIFDYWKIWMWVSVDTNLWCLENSPEGLIYYDGYRMNFWYALNHNFYKMNNKMYAYTGCTADYEEPLDFWDLGLKND